MSAVDDRTRRELARRAVAEALGTGLLTAAVIGSGIMATRLSPDDTGLQLLQNTIATGAALVALIVTFGSVSGAHFNPAVTLVARLRGSFDNVEAAAYAVAQVVGACVGAVAANVMFGLRVVELSTHDRSGGRLLFAEVIATAGLLLVIHGTTRTAAGAPYVPFTVAAWITSAYWFTSSTSFANPAVTIGRTLSDSFAGIAPASAVWFVIVQLSVAVAAVPLIRFLFQPEVTDDVVTVEA